MLKYKNIKVEWVTISIYLGDEFKNNHWKINEKYACKKLSETGLTNFSVECPIEDLICVQFAETPENVEKFYNKAKSVFNEVFVNLYLDGYLEEGNSIDISLDEYMKLLKENK